MGLKDVLHANRILVDPDCSTKDELLDQMVQLVCADPMCAIDLSSAAILQVVLERENQLSTGLQEGIAVPHGMIDENIETFAGMAVVPGGLEFDCMDGRPAMFIMLLIFSDGAKGRAQHVALLAETVGLFTDHEIRAAMLAATTADEAWHHLQRWFERAEA
jgi:mannitol/fructose-specific phosphotransferase system IIA component (Ntr-type)